MLIQQRPLATYFNISIANTLLPKAVSTPYLAVRLQAWFRLELAVQFEYLGRVDLHSPVFLVSEELDQQPSSQIALRRLSLLDPYKGRRWPSRYRGESSGRWFPHEHAVSMRSNFLPQRQQFEQTYSNPNENAQLSFVRSSCNRHPTFGQPRTLDPSGCLIVRAIENPIRVPAPDAMLPLTRHRGKSLLLAALEFQ